jgi:indole-3-glycerol phosphate synthase
MSVLSQILADKRTEVDCGRRRISNLDLERQIADLPPTRDFEGAIRNAPRPALIAEVKKASPSRGVIREDFDPVEIAITYAENGATCLSVLTDERYFQGHLRYLRSIREAVDLPLLRKDFIIDDYQILEARAAGADAILLIAAALTLTELEWMLEASAALGLAAIVEVHNKEEVEEALATDARIIGINNRDLHQFRTTLQTTLDLLPHIPNDRLIVSESGIHTRADVEKVADAGVHAVLVGEALMREPDIAGKMREMLGAA